MTQIFNLKSVVCGAVLAASLSLACITAKADGVVLSGPIGDGGTGFGSIVTILSLHNNGSETGGAAWNGSADVATGATPTDVDLGAPHSQTYSFSQLASLGFSSSNMRFVYNVNEAGNASGVNTVLTTMTIKVYSDAGNAGVPVELYSSTTCVGCGNNFPAYEQGQGNSGYLFTVDAAAQAQLLNFFLTCPSCRLGLYASVDDTQDGAEDFYIVNAQTAVPEPASILLLGTALIGTGGVLRRRFRK